MQKLLCDVAVSMDMSTEDVRMVYAKSCAMLLWDVPFITAVITPCRKAVSKALPKICCELYGDVLGSVLPVLNIIETYYRDNAALYESDLTPEQEKKEIVEIGLRDVCIEICIMNDIGYEYSSPEHKKLCTDFFSLASRYLDMLHMSDVPMLSDKMCCELLALCELAHKEFQVFLNSGRLS